MLLGRAVMRLKQAGLRDILETKLNSTSGGRSVMEKWKQSVLPFNARSCRERRRKSCASILQREWFFSTNYLPSKHKCHLPANSLPTCLDIILSDKLLDQSVNEKEPWEQNSSPFNSSSAIWGLQFSKSTCPSKE